MSRLGLGLGITKGGVIPFNPLSLDPYLLFDSETSMKGTLEAFTLDLDPSVPSSLDVITATRSGVATFTDANGVIQSASANTVRVDHTQGAELTPTKFQNITNTDFSTWATQRMTVSSGAGYEGYNSSIITAIESTGNKRLTATLSGVTAGQTHTSSIYVRRVSGSGTVQFENQSSTSGGDHNVTSQVGSDWTRIDTQFNGSTSGGVVTGFAIRLFTEGDSLEIAAPQVEIGGSPTTFVANTTGNPKFITGATFGPRSAMILVEPSATNLVTNTDFSSGWGLQSSTKQETDITSPFQSQNALRVTASETYGRIQDYIGSSSVTTISVYVKRDSTDSRVSINSDGFGAVTFNLTQAGASYHSLDGSPAGYDIKEHGDGWWRISASFSSVDYFKLYPDIELGTRSVLFALPQVEAGSVATSYIPTAGGDAAARTRAADDLVISGSAFSDFYNGSEGTFYVEVVDRQVTGSSHSYIVGQSASQFFLYKDSAAQIISFDAVTGMNKSPLVANQLMRLALTYKSASPASRSLSLDGSTSDGSYNGNFSSANILKIGGGYSDVFSGYFRRILFWPTHSDNL